MSLVIRLTQMGKKGERRFRVAVKEKRSKRDGKAIELLGFVTKTEKGIEKKLDTKRVEYWMGVGAKPSPTVKKLLSA